MNQYTLDYSDPRPDGWPPNRRSNRRQRGVLRQLTRISCLLVPGLAFVAASRILTDVWSYRTNYRTQTIRYDSLLAAKAETDRQIRLLHTQLKNTSPKP